MSKNSKIQNKNELIHSRDTYLNQKVVETQHHRVTAAQMLLRCIYFYL